MEATVGIETRQFVVFRLQDEEYGIDIQKVNTIEQVKPTARVPKTPKYINGVLNLRGEIVPIMDLRARFNLPRIEETEDTRIIIINTDGISLGMIVDSVTEVLQLTGESIDNVSDFNKELSYNYIFGVGKIEDRIVTLLNIEELARIE
jgi:purine-binding chemotaxis protein CheW